MLPGEVVALVFDASAIIDIADADADRTLLTVIAEGIAPVIVPVIVPTPVLGEVETLSEADCVALGLTLLA